MTALAALERIDLNQSLHEGHATPCQADPALFFPDTNLELAQAKRICVKCPARIDCRTGAFARHEGWGVWGGTFFYAGRPAISIPLRGQLSHRRYAS